MKTIYQYFNFTLIASFIFGSAAYSVDHGLAIRTVGLVPVQFFGDSAQKSEFIGVREMMKEGFSEYSRDSGRFRVLNDNLVLDYWHTDEGRRYLKKDFELDAYIGLNVKLNGDVVATTVRILDSNLKTLMWESSRTAARDWFDRNAELGKKNLRELVYKLINRLPFDVTVLSVQGEYVSLSGGSDQGLAVSQRLSLGAFQVAALHPADKTWLRFTKRKRGELKVISVQDRSAVAVIESESFPQSVSVGQGALVPNLPSRKYFKSVVQISSSNVVEEKPVVVGAQNNERVPPPIVRRNPSPPVPQNFVESEPLQNVQPPISNLEPLSEEQSPEMDSVVPEVEITQNSSEASVGSMFFKFITDQDYSNITLGLRNWSTSGVASSKSKTSLWLLNRFGFMADKKLKDFGGFLEWEAFFELGQTSKLFHGFGAEGALVYKSKLKIVNPNDKIRYGGSASFETRGVSGEAYGGHDLVLFGGLVGFEGQVEMMETKFRQVHDFDLYIFGVGQVGFNGSQNTASSATRMRLSSHFMNTRLRPDEWSWGGGFIWEKTSLKADTKKLNLDEIEFRALMTKKF